MARETKTISIQPDLNARMAKFPNENWSSIACRAFEIRLTELEGMIATNQVDAAISRLKASKMRAVDKLFREGELYGAWYVLKHADYMELERLVNSAERDLIDVESEDCSFKSLAHLMTGGDGSESRIESLMRDRGGDDIDHPKWLQGFVEGVCAKYKEIASKLD